MSRSLPMPSTPTLASIARKAGVSHSTVSLVLNERGQELRINPQTEARIREIARQVNYIPNQLARGLRGKRTNSIGVLWSLCGPHPSDGVARTITLEAQKNNYIAHLADSLSDPLLIEKMLDDLFRRRIDGVVVLLESSDVQTPAIYQQLARFPAAVAVSSSPLSLEGIDQVMYDRAPAFLQIVRHLQATGRRRLAFVGYQQTQKTFFLLQTMKQLGMEQPLTELQLKFTSTTRPHEYHELFAQLNPQLDHFDALLCNSDEMAAGACAYLRQRGLRVPEDMAVVGFNDSPFAPMLTPSLSSVSRNDLLVAHTAVKILLDRLRTPALPAQFVKIPMAFVPRESSQASAMLAHAAPKKKRVKA